MVQECVAVVLDCQAMRLRIQRKQLLYFADPQYVDALDKVVTHTNYVFLVAAYQQE